MDESYGQFCTVARGAEALCERWTPLVVRELLCGSKRFNELHRGVPRMSTSLLAQRLRHLEEMWRDQFDWVYREHEHAVFTMTIHPDVSGRPQVLLMLERLIEHIQGHAGVRFVTFDEIADDFVSRNPRT